MTAFQWVGLLWGTLTALCVPLAAADRARLAAHRPKLMCQGCANAQMQLWRREREYRRAFGPAGPPVMILAAAALWWVTPAIPALRRLARLPDLPRCAGPPCPAGKRHTAPHPDRPTRRHHA